MMTERLVVRSRSRGRPFGFNSCPIRLGEPADSRARSGLYRMNKMRMREGLELMIPDWSNSVW